MRRIIILKAELMIATKSLRIDYEDVTAVTDLTIEIPAGQIYGLVGPNGAGKTSTIKALAGIIEPTYGEIYIGGVDLALDHQAALQLVGYMPDFPPVYENLKVWEYCDVFAAAYLIPRHERLERCRYWIEKVNLTSKWDAYTRDLSRGMRQRLVLAKTLLPNPKIILLDEPASGLDPIARREFRDLLKSVAQQGVTILISSHILTELSDLCNAVGIMEKGKMIVSGSIEEIRQRMGTSSELIIKLAADNPGHRNKLNEILSTHPSIADIRNSSGVDFSMRFSATRTEAAKLLADLVARQVSISDFYIKEANVEDIFFKIGAKEVS